MQADFFGKLYNVCQLFLRNIENIFKMLIGDDKQIIIFGGKEDFEDTKV